MATATKKNQARQAVRRAAAGSKPAAIEFLVFEDNGGDHYWAILDSSGESLARSVPFATYEAAAHAAHVVRDGAGSAQFQARQAADSPVDLVARREAAIARGDSDAERWLDEAGT